MAPDPRYLNTPDGGGGTRFYTGTAVESASLVKDVAGRWTGAAADELVTVDAVKGRALCFFHNLVHEGVPVLEGEKYIIRSDLMYRRVPAILDGPGDREAYRLYHEADERAAQGDVAGSTALCAPRPLRAHALVRASLMLQPPHRYKRVMRLSPGIAATMGL